MIKLFCLPYAGGSAMIYSKWESWLDPGIKLIPLELAGRGRRIGESFYPNRQAAVDDIFRMMEPEMAGTAYVIFGHSLGSMIAYELAQKIRGLGRSQALHFFFSGNGAPHLSHKKVFHLMSEQDFEKELIALGGTPREIFENHELSSVFLPLLRNDFKLAETDLSAGPICPLDGDITVFLGKDDIFTPEECVGWKRHTNKLCNLHYFEGGHFFLHDHTEQMVLMINAIVKKALKERSVLPTRSHALPESY